jgi:CheY-like chemotaxis protein
MAYDPFHTGAGSAVPPQTVKKRLRILVVDDEPNVRGVISAHLNDEGYNAETANDGVQALELFKSGSWDLVMTDRVMPKMNGDELARAVKALNPNVPVILVTAFADRPPDPEGANSPFDLVIRKPFTRDTLRAAIALVRL